VTDNQAHRVTKFDTDGNFILQWGSQGTGASQFNYPRGIEVDGNGDVYVADGVNLHVQKFTGEGTYLLQWGTGGSGIGQFNSPEDIAVDPDGNIHVLDSTSQGVQKFTPTGTFICQGMDDDLGFSEGQLNSPRGIAIDSNGNILVMDSMNQRLLVFYNDLVEETTRASQPGATGSSTRADAILEINGSFEAEPALSDWTYGGTLPVSRSDNAYTGSYSLLLAQPTPAIPIGQSYAWAHNTVYVPTSWENPRLTLKYDMFFNDAIEASNLIIEILDGVGLNHLDTVLLEGYSNQADPEELPASGAHTGWRSVGFDLSAYKGMYIRINFSIRNHQSTSLGAWAYIDNVRVFDFDGNYPVFLPLINH
jgi:DNA-binding beta-propeller fold protein YncE